MGPPFAMSLANHERRQLARQDGGEWTGRRSKPFGVAKSGSASAPSAVSVRSRSTRAGSMLSRRPAVVARRAGPVMTSMYPTGGRGLRLGNTKGCRLPTHLGYFSDQDWPCC